MTQNILMTFCRSFMRYSPRKAAELLRMPVSQYRELECGNVLLNYKQARKMAKLYHSQAKYFYEASQQLDLLQTSRVLIQTLQAENDRLRADLNRLKEDRTL